MKASINLQQTFTDNFLAINPHIQINDLVDYLEPQSFNPETQKIGAIILVNGVATHEVIDFTPEEIAEANKPKVPQTARSMNFRLVLIQNGISTQAVYDLIDSLPTPQNQLAYQMFEYATHYDRNNTMINGLAQMMGISQEQLDDFFIQSENLVV